MVIRSQLGFAHFSVLLRTRKLGNSKSRTRKSLFCFQIFNVSHSKTISHKFSASSSIPCLYKNFHLKCGPSIIFIMSSSNFSWILSLPPFQSEFSMTLTASLNYDCHEDLACISTWPWIPFSISRKSLIVDGTE